MQTLELDPVIIAVIAGVWNAGHTLQQRYGITRIYGRKVGQADGTIELAVVGWFAFQWLRQERSAAEINPAKWLYPGSTTGRIAFTMVSPLGRAVRSRPGPLELMVMYTVGFATLIWAIRSFGSYDVYAFTFLTLGALHLFYDGLIWRLRRPDVARGFQIPSGL